MTIKKKKNNCEKKIILISSNSIWGRLVLFKNKINGKKNNKVKNNIFLKKNAASKIFTIEIINSI